MIFCTFFKSVFVWHSGLLVYDVIFIVGLKRLGAGSTWHHFSEAELSLCKSTHEDLVQNIISPENNFITSVVSLQTFLILFSHDIAGKLFIYCWTKFTHSLNSINDFFARAKIHLQKCMRPISRKNVVKWIPIIDLHSCMYIYFQ